MKSRIITLILSVCFLQQTGFCDVEEPKTLPIGSTAPNFSLKGIDNKTYSLSSFSKYNLLVIIFTCNHCPTAQAYEDRIIKLVKDYSPKNVGIVAVSPNNPAAVRLDELGYTDLSDSFEEMKTRAKKKSSTSLISMMAISRPCQKLMVR